MTNPKHKADEPKTADEPTTPAEDPRHPDTQADVGVQPPDLDPEQYGFRTIEVTDVDETGPGSVEPTKVESVAGAGSTFSDRAKARGGNKAVQSAENK
jgi:hypothetical protein